MWGKGKEEKKGGGNSGVGARQAETLDGDTASRESGGSGGAWCVVRGALHAPFESFASVRLKIF